MQLGVNKERGAVDNQLLQKISMNAWEPAGDL
jgi:hypothetical protein